jgi:hypothetical protein
MLHAQTLPSLADLIDEAEMLARHPGPCPGGYRFWNWYARYLACSDWAALRQQVLARDEHTCRCGEPATQVHHLTYARVGHERLTDLVAICDACHDLRHGRRTPDQEAAA